MNKSERKRMLCVSLAAGAIQKLQENSRVDRIQERGGICREAKNNGWMGWGPGAGHCAASGFVSLPEYLRIPSGKLLWGAGSASASCPTGEIKTECPTLFTTMTPGRAPMSRTFWRNAPTSWAITGSRNNTPKAAPPRCGCNVTGPPLRYNNGEETEENSDYSRPAICLMAFMAKVRVRPMATPAIRQG